MIHIIGDSHALTFEGLQDCKIHYLGPVTMHRIGRDGIDIKSLGVNENDFIVFTIGEIDVRCHIGIQRDKHRRETNEIIGTLTDNFIDAIKKNKTTPHKNIEFIICSIVPPSDISYNPDFPYYGEISDRVSITNKLNASLETKCAQNKIHFINTYGYYSLDNGALNPLLSDGNIHIHKQYRREIEGQLFKIINTINAGRELSEINEITNDFSTNDKKSVNNFDIPPYGRKLTFNLLKDIVASAMYNNLVILELGMTSTNDIWDGYGYSTPFFAYIANIKKGELFSVDIDAEKRNICKSILNKYHLYTDRAHLIVEDGISFLSIWGKNIITPIDVLYLDAWDYGEGEIGRVSEENHLKAFQTVENYLSDKALILIDDIHDTQTLRGKGKLVIPYLLKKGYIPLYIGYQCLFTRNKPEILSHINNIRYDALMEIKDIDRTTSSAIQYLQNGESQQAGYLFEKILRVQPNNVVHFTFMD